MESTHRRDRRRVSDLAGTQRVARGLAPRLRRAARDGRTPVVTLHGPLGAGKTTFVRLLVDALGIDPAPVTSPTFSIINTYPGVPRIYHVDLYRIASARELAGLDLEDVLGEPGAVVLVEWPDIANALLPVDVIRVILEFDPPDGAARVISIDPDPRAERRCGPARTRRRGSSGGATP